MKILIVEDDKRVGRFIERALEEQTYTVRRVENCADARDALSESPFGAVVLDLGLPDGDGLELLREWRAAGFDEPVLILCTRCGGRSYSRIESGGGRLSAEAVRAT